MKYKLLKDLPGIKVGDIIDEISLGFNLKKHPGNYPDFFEPIVEKKTYDDLKEGDEAWYINGRGPVYSAYFREGDNRSETFLTREEAEDEHKRREWAVRKDKFVPNEGEKYYQPTDKKGTIISLYNTKSAEDYLCINLGLAFRTREDCQDAIDNHDLIRLFYTIR